MVIGTPREFGAAIRAQRNKLHYTQAALAAFTGFSVSFLSDLENGKGTIQVQKLLKVLQTLGLGLFIYSPWDNK